MMTKVYPELINSSSVQQLLDYMDINDDRTVLRPDRIMKAPKWDIDDFPQQLFKPILDQVHEHPYVVDTVLFNNIRIGLKVHADTGWDSKPEKLYKTVLIPLWFDGPSSTITFNNRWYGDMSRFGKKPVSTFFCDIPDIYGNLRPVDDIRILLEECKSTPENVNHFAVDQQFVDILESIVIKRSEPTYVPEQFTTDYNLIENYDPNLQFDEEMHKKYFKHIPIENLHGLTLESIVPWEIGSVITFDRTQLHCAGFGHKQKISVTLFTNRI